MKNGKMKMRRKVSNFKRTSHKDVRAFQESPTRTSQKKWNAETIKFNRTAWRFQREASPCSLAMIKTPYGIYYKLNATAIRMVIVRMKSVLCFSECRMTTGIAVSKPLKSLPFCFKYAITFCFLLQDGFSSSQAPENNIWSRGVGSPY
jgi:hypothetical protein